MRMLQGRWASIGLAMVLAAWIVVVFHPVLGADFHGDDLVHLYDLANYGLVKLLLSPQAGHPKSVSNGAYAVARAAFGLTPPWFATLLALHVVNGLLLFGLLRRAHCARLIAFAAAAAWALAPVHVGVLAWFATIGQPLMITLVLLLCDDMVGVAATGRITAARCAYWFALSLLIANSHGMGVGIAAAVWLAATVLLPARARRGAVLALAALLVVIPSLYAAQFALYRRLFDVSLFYAPQLPGAPLTVLVGDIVRLFVDLVVYGLSAIVSGFHVHPTGGEVHGAWRDVPIDTLLARLRVPALICLVLMVWGLRGAPRNRQAYAMGLAALALGAYAAVAGGLVLGGRVHGLTTLGYAAATASAISAIVARNHYAPTMLLIAVVALAVDAIAERGAFSRRVVLAVLLVVVGGLAVRTPAYRAEIRRAVTRDRILSSQHAALAGIEAVVRRGQPGNPVYVPNQPLGGGVIGLHADWLPGWAAVGVIYSQGQVIDGRPVRFVESDPQLLATLRKQAGTPIARLVVAPDEVPEQASAAP